MDAILGHIVQRGNNTPEEFVDSLAPTPTIIRSAAVRLDATERETPMPLELRPGMGVPIPCRHCQKGFIRFTVAEGLHPVACPRCGATTEVEVYSEGSALRLRTSPGEPPQKPR